MPSSFLTLNELNSLVESQVSEGLTLEFKLKENPGTSDLSRTDKRSIAEAVSSFANSDGGTLIYGVRSDRRGGSDVAAELVPITNVDRFVDQFRMVCALNVSPELPSVMLHTVREEAGNGGYLVCSVGRSDRRPHMSTAPGIHSYFRRSFSGNVPMTPSEIRDQILAVRDAVIEPVVVVGAGGSFTNQGPWISVRSGITFRLKNVGRTLCRNPFLRVRASCLLHSHSANYDEALGSWNTSFADGTFIHTEDHLACLSLSYHAYIRLDVLQLRFQQSLPDLTEAVIIAPGSDDFRTDTISDKKSLEEIELTLRFGAENAAALEQTETLTRKELAQNLLAQSSVRDMAVHTIGPFRSDLVDAFRSQ